MARDCHGLDLFMEANIRFVCIIEEREKSARKSTVEVDMMFSDAEVREDLEDGIKVIGCSFHRRTDGEVYDGDARFVAEDIFCHKLY